jgi:hypothetical protein
MNSGQVAFYSTVATVIPVMLLGYIAGAVALTRPRVEALTGKMPPVVGEVMGFIKLVAGFRIIPLMPLTMTMAFVTALVLLALIAVPVAILLALFGLPAAGEYFSLHALLSNKSTSQETTYAALGLAISVAAVLLPPFYVVVVSPLAKMVKPIKEEFRKSDEQWQEKIDSIQKAG